MLFGERKDVNPAMDGESGGKKMKSTSFHLELILLLLLLLFFFVEIIFLFTSPGIVAGAFFAN